MPNVGQTIILLLSGVEFGKKNKIDTEERKNSETNLD